MTRRDHSRHTGTALEKWYQFLCWLLPTIEKFPRAHKFTLGDRLQEGALSVLERLQALLDEIDNLSAAQQSL